MNSANLNRWRTMGDEGSGHTFQWEPAPSPLEQASEAVETAILEADDVDTVRELVDILDQIEEVEE